MNMSTLLLALSVSMAMAAVAAREPLAVARPSFQNVTLTGFSRARATLPLVAESSGNVLQVSADIGQPIGPDGVFARLDDTFVGLDLEANQVQQQKLESQLQYDAREVKRIRPLAQKGSASKARLDELEQTYRDHGHQLDALRIQARVLAERLARTAVSAEPGWLVTARAVEPGQRVTEGEILGEIGDFSTLLVPFALSPGQLAVLGEDPQDLEVSLPDWSLQLPARIYRVNPGFDAATRKTSVSLAIDEGVPQRRGGLRVQLSLRLPEASGAVMLPDTAVEQSYDEYWVTREDGERLQVVRLGNHSGPDGTWIRLSAPRVKPGDRFRLVVQD